MILHGSCFLTETLNLINHVWCDMKTFVQAALIFLLIVLTLFFMVQKFSAATLETELQNSLDKALEHALTVALENNVYTIETKEELAADVMYELFTTCNAKADYKIVFNEIDIKNGLVDVQVTQTIKFSPLIKTEVTCRRTILLEESKDTAS